jgi:single-stranded-DNA-specific exonuclease
MTHDDATGIVQSDGELSRDEFTLEVAHLLRESGPWGQAFPEPLFDGEFVVRAVRVLGERHLKMEVLRDDRLCDAIAFRHFDHEDSPQVEPGQRVRLAYRLDVNQYNGTERLQLVVEYLERSG